MARVLFVHRSVGRNLLHDGKVRQYVAKLPTPFELDDYDQNTDLLTTASGQTKTKGFVFPGGDTKPADYAAIFCNPMDDNFQPIRDFILGYDIIVIKSCYPNSNIRSNEALNAMKTSYRSVADYFSGLSPKRLVILSSPPMSPFMTSAANAARGRAMANWLGNTNFGPNVHVFDFFNQLAAPENGRFANRLRWDYQRWLPFDSHPNAKASQRVAPLLVDFLARHATITT